MKPLSHTHEIREVSTPEDRARESQMVHIVGERTEQETVYKIPLSMRFESDLSSHEVEPVIGVHCTLRKPPKIGYTRFPVVWEEGKDGTQSITHKIMVHVGTESPWPYDASVVVQVFAKIKSSEGAWRLEKSGSACLPLNKLIEPAKDPIREMINEKLNNKRRQQQKTQRKKMENKSDTNRAVYAMPLVLQSARMLIDKPFYKGKIIIAHKYGTISMRTRKSDGRGGFTWTNPTLTKTHFSQETTWDAVNKNVTFLERRIMRSVNKSMAPFLPDIAKATGVKNGFTPTVDSLSRIHFPFFVTEVSAIPGARYFSNYVAEEYYDEHLHTSLMHIALERKHISVEEFLAVGNAFVTGELESTDTVIDDIPYDTRMTKISSAFVEACTIVATSVPYIGDYVDFNEDRLRKVPFDKQKSHISTESCGDALATGSDDCEGVAKVTTRVYTGFRDINHSKGNEILRVSKAIANHYICMGALGSVTARNLSESKGKENDDDDDDDDEGINAEGITLIESKRDLKQGIGAHMWVMFFPKRYAFRMLDRTWNNPRVKLHWTDDTTEDDYPVWNERLPVLVGEGTGMLEPRLAPVSAYESGIDAKRKAVNGDIRHRDATMRLMSGVKVRDLQDAAINHKNLSIEKPGELARVQMQKGQEGMMEDRNARLSSFYRRVSALFPIVTQHEEFPNKMFSQAEAELPSRWCNRDTNDFLDEQGAPVYTWRMVVPVQMGKKRPTFWKPKYDAPGKQTDFVMNDIHWGVNIEDFIYKRDHVALMRMPGNTVMQEKAVGSVVRHLPPLVSLCSLDEEQEKMVNMTMKSLNASMKKALVSKKGEENFLSMNHPAFNEKSSQLDDGTPTETVHLYIRSQDFTSDQAKRIIDRVSDCPYVLSARFVSEVVTPSVGSIRVETLINNEDYAELNEKGKSGFQWTTDKPIY